jgi:hypothetical protein
VEFLVNLQALGADSIRAAASALRGLKEEAKAVSPAVEASTKAIPAAAASSRSLAGALDLAGRAWTRLRASAVQADLAKEQTKLAALQATMGRLGKAGAVDISIGSRLNKDIQASTQRVAQLSGRLAAAGLAGKPIQKPNALIEALGKNAALTRTALTKLASPLSVTLGGLGKLAAVAGIGFGAAELARLALGYRGVAQLQAISQRTQFSFRALFSGIDPAPVVRAADRFSRNFDKSTASGRAMSGIFERSFNSLFRFLERIEPVATAAFKGLLIGALKVEIGILKARIALFPYTSALEDAALSTEGLGMAADLASGAVQAIGAAVQAVLEPIAAGVKLVTSLALAFRTVKVEGGSVGEASGAMAKALPPSARPKAPSAAPTSGNAVSPAVIDAARAVGKQTGEAYGKGLVGGIDASAGAAMAAGGRAAGAVDKGVRDKAQIRSPSRVAHQRGEQMGEGVERGIDARAPRIQAAAERSMVPDLSGLGAVAAGGRGGTPSRSLTFGDINVTIQGANLSTAGDLVASVEAAMPEILHRIAGQLGVAEPA